MNVIVKVGGVVTLPDEVLEGLELEEGNEIAFKRRASGGFTLEKASEVKAPPLTRDEIKRRIQAAIGAAGPGPNTDEFMALMRGDD